MPKNLPVNIVCFGDSLTEAKSEAEGDKWPSQLQNLLNEWRPQGYRVFNRGISGNTTAQALERIESDVLSFMPGWVLVEFGGNDANIRSYRRTPRVGVHDFESNLAEIHRLVTEAGGRAAFIAIHAPDLDGRTKAQGGKGGQGNGASYAENFLPYQRAIHRLSRRHKIPLLDISASLTEASHETKDIVCRDGIHLTTAGNAFYADTVFPWLSKLLS